MDSLQVVEQTGEKGSKYNLPRTLDLRAFQNNIEITFTLSHLTRNFPWFSFCMREFIIVVIDCW